MFLKNLLIAVAGLALMVSPLLADKPATTGQPDKTSLSLVNYMVTQLNLTKAQSLKLFPLLDQMEKSRLDNFRQALSLRTSLKQALVERASDAELTVLLDKVNTLRQDVKTLEDQLFTEVGKILSTAQLAKFMLINRDIVISRNKLSKKTKRQMKPKSSDPIKRWQLDIEKPSTRPFAETNRSHKRNPDPLSVDITQPNRHAFDEETEFNSDRYPDRFEVDIRQPKKRFFNE